MITRQVEHPHTMAMALAGALRAISSNGLPKHGRGNLEITLEGDPFLAALGRRSSTRWCATCGSGFRVVTAFAATSMADVSFLTLYRWAETGEVHFSVTVEGSLFVCLNSLLERVSAQD